MLRLKQGPHPFCQKERTRGLSGLGGCQSDRSEDDTGEEQNNQQEKKKKSGNFMASSVHVMREGTLFSFLLNLYIVKRRRGALRKQFLSWTLMDTTEVATRARTPLSLFLGVKSLCVPTILQNSELDSCTVNLKEHSEQALDIPRESMSLLLYRYRRVRTGTARPSHSYDRAPQATVPLLQAIIRRQKKKTLIVSLYDFWFFRHVRLVS